MKFRRSCIYLVALAIMFLSSILVSAETHTDETGDVYHWNLTDATWGWKPSTEARPNIDITELTYTSNENQLTLIMKVAGSIESSENILYVAWVNTSDAFYWLYWMNGQSSGMAMNTEEGSLQFAEPNVTVSGNTINCIYDIVGDDINSTEFWGYAAEYEVFGDITKDWWGDWIPGTYSPFFGQNEDDNGDGNGTGGGDDTGNGGTPGFEALAVITAISIAFIVLRRRR